MTSSQRSGTGERDSPPAHRRASVNPAEFMDRLSLSVGQNAFIAMLVAAVGGVLSTSVCPCTLPAGIGIVGYVGSSAETVARSGRLVSRHWRGAVLSGAFFVNAFLTRPFASEAAPMARSRTACSTASRRSRHPPGR